MFADLVLPFCPYIVGENFLLMHDNTCPQITGIVADYLQDVGIHVLPWPVSPDMNPIEHVWDILG